MALVRVLVVLCAGDVIVVLPAFFRSRYRFVVPCLSLASNQDFLAFSICDVSTLVPCIDLRLYVPLILSSIFSVFLHAMA